MSNFQCGVVIPASPDREDNLLKVISALNKSEHKPREIVVVCDGWDRFPKTDADLFDIPVQYVIEDKYVPSTGMEQPRNIGVNHLSDECNHVWFLDSDCLPYEDTYKAFWVAHGGVNRIMIGPYDWMPEGATKPNFKLNNDPRWDMFFQYEPQEIKVNDLGMGLGCFSGNLVWPIKEFKLIGGFWNELNMGRCEDGELGLRAASLGMPMSVVRNARAWHMGHPIDYTRTYEANTRDVPLLHERHGKVEETGLKIVNEDGKRLNYVCPDCGEEFNTLEYWSHSCNN